MISAALLLLAGPALAYPPLLSSRAAFTGIATFNDYAAQSGTACGPKSGTDGTYGAAAGDLSPDISGGKCGGGVNTGCSGQGPASGFQPPVCPKTNCGKCYKVTNQGAVGGGSVGGVGNTITVQIIDACPSDSAQNTCKTNVPTNQRCVDPSTNQLDIDQSAYVVLTGLVFGGGPTLEIGITPTECPGGGGGGGSTSTGTEPAAVSAAAAASSVAVPSETPGITQVGTGNQPVHPGVRGNGTTTSSSVCKKSKKHKKSKRSKAKPVQIRHTLPRS